MVRCQLVFRMEPVNICRALIALATSSGTFLAACYRHATQWVDKSLIVNRMLLAYLNKSAHFIPGAPFPNIFYL